MRQISDEVIEQVEGLLEEGHSQRHAARIAGVSLGTVNRVANGQRSNPVDAPHQPDEEEAERCGPIRRCGQCGHLVEMPCLICQARAVREQTLRKRRQQCAAMTAAQAQRGTTGGVHLRHESLLKAEGTRKTFCDRRRAS